MKKILPDTKKFNDGLKTRKEVLGEDYVNKSLSNADDFTMDIQKLIQPILKTIRYGSVCLVICCYFTVRFIFSKNSRLYQ